MITGTKATTYPIMQTTTRVLTRMMVDLTFATDMWAIATERADGLERKTGKCFNCQDVGHYCRECLKPLKEDFKHLRDQPKR